ncbi:hypothetical protein N7492_010129 [Penicillium capsulatum]|uniref:Glutaredoxin domain-containing protein n=1 Tax=Penicillium capsulatum TaxID=69766 RepID=A0A9W9HMT7_9EURO|nr:hypothetical protein N7492_010129 [Penicillium capsulatum]
MKAKEDAKHARTKEKIQEAMAHPGVKVGSKPVDKPDIERPVVPAAKEKEKQEVEIEEIPIAGRTKMTVPKNKEKNEQDISNSPPSPGSDASKEQVVDHQDPKTEMNTILKKSPIIIFSKSYCPYSMKAKSILLDGYTISPKPYVVELDLHPTGQDLQKILEQTTGRRTVPNILVNGKSIGGGDDIAAMDQSDDLASKLRSLGGKWIVDVSRGPVREQPL